MCLSNCMYVCVCALCVCLCVQRVEEGIRSPETLLEGTCKLQYRCGKSNTSSSVVLLMSCWSPSLTPS